MKFDAATRSVECFRARLTDVKSHPVVVGTLAKVDEVLASCDWQINTAILKRLNLSLRRLLAKSVPTNGNGSAKVWQPRTPAMAAGHTDQVWSLREVLLFRVPPWPQPQTV